MANADISLHDDGDGWVKVEAGDLNVDSPARRKGGVTGSGPGSGGTLYRRALVHDFNDGLTINWANDYTGGVTINGLRQIHSKPKDITGPHPGVDLAIDGNIEFSDALQINGDSRFLGKADFEGQVIVRKVILTPIKQSSGVTVNVPIPIVFDVANQLQQLTDDVAQLKKALNIQ